MELTSLTRLAEYASTDRAVLEKLIDDVRIGHVGFVVDGQPVVIPTAVIRDRDRVLMHGSTGSGWMRRLAADVPMALSVTAVDGLVVARTAFESSMLYRSAVIFGTCRRLTDADEKLAALDTITEGLLPGRSEEVRRPSDKELAATLVLALPLDRWSLKVSDGWPEDLDSDIEGPAWGGVVPMTTVYGDPLRAPDLRDGIDVPPSVRNLVQSG